MGQKIAVEDIDIKDEAGILEDTLCWLEENVEIELYEFVESYRFSFKERFEERFSERN